jgi:hypothetical protein
MIVAGDSSELRDPSGSAVLSRSFSGSGNGLHEDAREHDPLEAVSADSLDDMERPITVGDFRRFLDKETRIEFVGHSLALSTLKTTERTICVRFFINGSRTEQQSRELTSISFGEH